MRQETMPHVLQRTLAVANQPHASQEIPLRKDNQTTNADVVAGSSQNVVGKKPDIAEHPDNLSSKNKMVSILSS